MIEKILTKKLLSAAALVIACGSAMAQWPSMQTDTLTNNNTPDETVFKSLDNDNMDTLHLIWKAAGSNGNDILYSRRSCSLQWSAPRYVNDTIFGAGDAFLGVDKINGTPYIAYVSYTTAGSEVIIAKDSAGTWSRTQLTNTPTDEYSPTVAVDGNGYVHVAWIGLDQNSNYRIFYSTNLSGMWVTQTLTSSMLGAYGSGAQPFIAVTSAGVAYISYRGGNYQSYRIHLANNTTPGGTSWNYQVITTLNTEDFISTINVSGSTLHLVAEGNDGWGFPLVSYYTQCSTSSPTTWSAQQQVSSSVYGDISPVYIDGQGNAHLMINEVSGNILTGDTHYATNASGTWSTTPVSTQQSTYEASVVIGSNNNKVGVAYHELNYSLNSHEIIVWASGTCESLPTNIDEIANEPRILVFPNPSPGSFTAEVSSTISELVLMDVTGRIAWKASNIAGNRVEVKDTGISKGIYFIKVITADAQVLTQKILIE